MEIIPWSTKVTLIRSDWYFQNKSCCQPLRVAQNWKLSNLSCMPVLNTATEQHFLDFCHLERLIKLATGRKLRNEEKSPGGTQSLLGGCKVTKKHDLVQKRALPSKPSKIRDGAGCLSRSLTGVLLSNNTLNATTAGWKIKYSNTTE